MRNHLSEVIDCLYDTYIYQRTKLEKYGYARQEAFWIHFASVPFLPWFENNQNIVPLSHLIKFYYQIFNDEIMLCENRKIKAQIRHLLQSKFSSAYGLAKKSFVSELNLKFALDVGTSVLPHIDDAFKLALSGLVIINTKPIYQRSNRYFSLGRLVQDLDIIPRMETAEYAAAL